jgi:hypothetical protein
MKYMPTNPIIDVVSCVSRGGDCRHAAPPFGLQGRPAIILSPQRPGGGKASSTSPLLPRCLFQCVACRWGSRLLVQTTDFAANPGRPTLSVLSAARLARSTHSDMSSQIIPLKSRVDLRPIQPNFGHGDHSRLSCSTGDTQLEPHRSRSASSAARRRDRSAPWLLGCRRQLLRKVLVLILSHLREYEHAEEQP